MAEEIDVVFKEPKTLKESLKPMIFFAWIMGTGSGMPKDLKTVTILIKLIHYSLCSMVIAWGVIDFFKFHSILSSEMYKMMYYTNKAVVYVASYYYVSLSLVKYKNWRKFIERIESLDKKIRREIIVKDRGIKILQIIVFLATAILGPFSAISHVIYYLLTDKTQIFASDILLYYTISLSLATNFWFDIVVLIVHQRFKLVNKLIKQIGDTYTAPWIVLKIQRSRELHYEACGLVRILNEIHDLHMLMSSTNSFMMVIATLFRIYIGLAELRFDFIVVNNIMWMVYAAQFAINCYVCTLTCREAANTGIIIYDVGLKNNQLTNKKLYTNNPRRSLSYQPESKTYEGSSVQNEIDHFSSQLQQNRVYFSACGFFELDNALLQAFIGVITTYLIILIQFYEPPKHSDKEQISNSNITTNNGSYLSNITEQLFIIDE